MCAEVLIELKLNNNDKTYTYLIPDEIKSKIKIGMRVLVPFGKQTLEGFVLNIESLNNIDYNLKSIIKLIDETPVLNEELLELGKYISKKTLSSLISVYQTMLPRALKAHNKVSIKEKYFTYLKLSDYNYIPKNDNQIKIINYLKDNDLVLKSELAKISLSSVNTLINKKVLIEERKEVYRTIDSNKYLDKKRKLTVEQEKAIKEVLNNLNTFIPYLLFGVTGSGKTEVYMNIIESVLKQNKQIIVLVPEISLTPQFVSIFKARFKDKIAILHSALSSGEKYDEWRKIVRNEVSIVIGARSAIFAPFNNLGLIVLDEEHSDTYRQDSYPKYDAIDVAIKRAKTHNCPIILGSATPSIESFTRYKQGVYKILELKNRVNNNMPLVEIVDMRTESKKGNRVISSVLKKEIEEVLSKDEQVILLLNRRGYSTTISCKNCGEVIKCPNCDIPLIYHKSGNKLNCHYCNHTTFKPNKCPSCNSEELSSFGLGTEKLEEIISSAFTDAKVVRMDADTTKKKRSHEKIIEDFREKKYNILIGTQMVAKGLDFEDVTLVGVINGDETLNVPDFRSSERTFDLLNQVSGRAGRSKKNGKVIIQCFNTDHYSIVCASRNEYLKFYDNDMQIRKKLKYPPYFNLCLIKLSSNNLELLNLEALKVKKHLEENTKDIIILGPSMCNMPKISNKYYMQILIKYKKIDQIYDQVKYIIYKSNTNNKVRTDIEFNPKRI